MDMFSSFIPKIALNYSIFGKCKWHINEDIRIQLELINETLAELQVKNKLLNKPRNPIGFAAHLYTQ